MLTTKKTFQTKFLSTLLILALVSTMILAPTALAAGFGGSSITTAVADSGARNFTPTEAANDRFQIAGTVKCSRSIHDP